MFIAMLFSTALVFTTVLVHYEVMRYTTLILPHLPLRPRQLILVVIAAMFFAHTVEVWMHAYAFYLIADRFGLGGFGGAIRGEFHDYLYFSTVTYTSLGLGDVYPLGGLRLMSGVESLAGLVMIAWSASFTYLNMEKFWNMHAAYKPRRRRKK